MEEEKSKASEFKVVDKRRFSEDGEESPESIAAADTKSVEQPVSEEPESKNSELRGDSLDGEQEEAKGVPQSVDFSSFIVSMATQALMMMGEIPNPESKTTSMNLSAAKQTVDILGMLEEKTRGNLTGEESELISEVLVSLRMAFVNKVNQ